jgi:hypothetical protein
MAKGLTKFTAEARAEYLERIRKGGRRTATARSLNVNPRTVQKAMWRTNPESGLSEPTAFGQQVLAAEREADEPIESVLYWQATLKEDTASALKARIFWLTNRGPDRWREAATLRQEVSGPGGGPIQHTHELDPHAKEEIFAKINAMGANLARSRDLPGLSPTPAVETTAHEEAEEA